MSWRIEILPSAEKHYLKLDSTTRRRIKKALLELESADRPLARSLVEGATTA